MTTNSKIMEFAQKINVVNEEESDGEITAEDMKKYGEKLNSRRCSSVTNFDDDFLYHNGPITDGDMRLFKPIRN